MFATAYRPVPRAAWKPTASLASVQPFNLGQNAADGVGVPGVIGTLLGLGISGSAAYVGISAGLKQKGAHSVLGWVVGLSGALAGLATLTALLGAAFKKPAQTTTSEGTVAQQ
jgi:hypothetical protein